MSDYMLELCDVSKSFPGVKALDGVSFALRRGEIHALVGENGAGKSTLIKIITGVHRPDGGRIVLDGATISFADPLSAQKNGIAAIYQEPTTFPDLSVAENIFMGHPILAKVLPGGAIAHPGDWIPLPSGLEGDVRKPQGCWASSRWISILGLR